MAGVGLVLSAIVGCRPDLPTERTDLPIVAGLWAYSASDIRIQGRGPGSVCQIQGMTLELGPWRPTGFFGRTSGGSLNCAQDLDVISGPLPSYPVRRGGAVLHFIAFDIGTPDWRHDGTISGDTMTGRFLLRQGTIQMNGTFQAVLVSPGTASPTAGLSLPTVE